MTKSGNKLKESASCNFGKTIFDRDNYICKKGKNRLILELHGFTKTGSRGKPVFGEYGIEIVTGKDPYEVKYYFNDTSSSYPNYVDSPFFKNKQIAKKFMKDWAKRNNNEISKFFVEFEHIKDLK